MIQVRQDTIAFGRAVDVGPRTAFRDIDFTGTVTQAAAVLTGFDVRFSRGNDHNLGQLEVSL